MHVSRDLTGEAACLHAAREAATLPSHLPFHAAREAATLPSHLPFHAAREAATLPSHLPFHAHSPLPQERLLRATTRKRQWWEAGGGAAHSREHSPASHHADGEETRAQRAARRAAILHGECMGGGAWAHLGTCVARVAQAPWTLALPLVPPLPPTNPTLACTHTSPAAGDDEKDEDEDEAYARQLDAELNAGRRTRVQPPKQAAAAGRASARAGGGRAAGRRPSYRDIDDIEEWEEGRSASEGSEQELESPRVGARRGGRRGHAAPRARRVMDESEASSDEDDDNEEEAEVRGQCGGWCWCWC
jgi:hypothetical protein